MIKKSAIHDRLRQLIRMRFGSQAVFARNLQMQPSHLNHFLKGHGDVRSETLVQILGELGIDLEKILEKELAKANGTELVDQMSSGEVIDALMSTMDRDDRRAMVGYTVKFALASIGQSARPKLKRLRELM